MRFDNVPRLASLERGNNSPLVAYFSMEIAASPAIPTYSGGLGVLAGEHGGWQSRCDACWPA